MTKIRTRVAPSPTGDPHVGTAYIALFNRCFAHHHQGQFILRIEDTDQVRSSTESETRILESLKWLGLDWDEGPDNGGNYGPYRQSERSEIYTNQIDKLLSNGTAFPCFCTPERLQKLRQQQVAEKLTPGYDGHCLGLTDSEIRNKTAAKEIHVIRMKVPEQGDCVFSDGLRGEIVIPWAQIDMQVLIKSDGLPTYHFANVVDDHLMAISHVIRGEEWINSTPKHLLLYQYFGWQAPEFYHMPLLRNPDKSKLSKRKNPTSILYYRDMGYLPQALVNYLGLMGWTLPGGEEMFSLDEMTSQFDLSRVSLGGPVFDLEKLAWLNGKYLREAMSDDELVRQFLEWADNGNKIRQALPLIRPRIEKFSDVLPLAGFLFGNLPALEAAQFDSKALDADGMRKVLQFSLWRLENIDTWNREQVELELQQLAENMTLKFRDFLLPLFVAITGKAVSVSVIDAIAILGPDLARTRLRQALELLGGVSKKQLKTYEKEYQGIN